MKTYVLDTNIILEDVANIFKLHNQENRIIIPGPVIDELDAKKTDPSELGYRAREFARLVDDSFIQELDLPLKENSKVIKLYNKKHNIDFYIYDLDVFKSTGEYIKEKSILYDRKIIEICKHIENCVFISLDSMCRIRAVSEGIQTETLKGSQDSQEFCFLKELNITDIPDILLDKNGDIPDNTDVTLVDPDYKLDNFNYKVNYPSGYTKIYQVFNKKMCLLDEANIEKQDIKPINLGQKLMAGAILSDYVDIVIVNSIAGSGKSLVSISNAIKLVKEKKYNKIVYIRNSIESVDKGEEVGFLPGLEEKFAIYNHPLYDSLRYIAKEQLRRSNSNKSIKEHIDESKIEEKAQEIQKKYNIETMWVGELRGRTISDAVVICDEFQNFGSKTSQTTVSRLDKTCKLVVIGSNNQIDNLYTNKYTNGLTMLLNATKKENPEVNIFACNLNKVVRGPITAFAERVFSN